METKSFRWKIQELRDKFHVIAYPEFQREPTIWSLRQKRLLVDSILRGFDIGSIYLVADGKEFQCVDGRQRLSAIFSFMGINKSEIRDNGFEFVSDNEVREDHSFDEVRNARFDSKAFENLSKIFLAYEVAIVLISKVDDETDLNLQFQRLQIAQILNAAEKLNAMVGAMRDQIFGDVGLGAAEYFGAVGMRNERYGRQQSASQTAINAVAYAHGDGFCRARFIDMQQFFKEHFKLTPLAERVLAQLRSNTGFMVSELSQKTLKRIRNRALVVSVLLFVFVHKHDNSFEAEVWKQFDQFLSEVLDRLDEIADLTLVNMSGTWERLQLAITQASVEKSAIATRHEILTAEFKTFTTHGKGRRKP